VFFVAFMPQFISPNASLTRQLWVFAVTFIALATITESGDGAENGDGVY
jgi:threonine/homoserine/homoserine lactone efflux protein